jgi:hypothetical protein
VCLPGHASCEGLIGSDPREPKLRLDLSIGWERAGQDPSRAPDAVGRPTTPWQRQGLSAPRAPGQPKANDASGRERRERNPAKKGVIGELGVDLSVAGAGFRTWPEQDARAVP